MTRATWCALLLLFLLPAVHPLAPGLYLLRLESEGRAETRRIVVID